jgi:hypothetical protein
MWSYYDWVLYDKNCESDYFFFLHQNQNIFFSNIGNQNIFLEKKHNFDQPHLILTHYPLHHREGQPFFKQMLSLTDKDSKCATYQHIIKVQTV